MNLSEHDKSTGAMAVRVVCIRCRKLRWLAHVRCDLDGPSFIAYFCDTPAGYYSDMPKEEGKDCTPRTEAEADEIYRLNHYVWTKEGRWSAIAMEGD